MSVEPAYPSRPSARAWAILLLIILTGLALRLWLGATRPMWLDEIFSRDNSLRAGVKDLLLFKSAEHRHPPLSFLLIKLSVHVLHSRGALASRSTSMLAGVACICLAFQLGRTIASDGFGLLLAAVCAFDPLAVDQSAQARMFTLALAPALYGLTQTIRGLQEILAGDTRLIKSRAEHAGLALAAGFWSNLLLATLWCAIVASGVMIAAIPAWFGAEPQRTSRIRRQLLGFLARISVVFAVLSAVVVIRLGRYHDSAPLPSEDSVIRYSTVFGIVLKRLSYLVAVARHDTAIYILVCLFVVGGIAMLWRRSRPASVFCGWILLVGIVFAFPLAMQQGFIHERYFMLLLPVVWLGIAGWTIAFTGWKKVATIVVVLGIVASQTYASIRLPSNWIADHQYRIVPEIESTKPLRSPSDRVVYAGPCLNLYMAYCEPREFLQINNAKTNAPVTWLILLRVGKSDEESARSTLRTLGAQYGVAVDDINLENELLREQVMILRFAEHHVELLRFGADPRTGPIDFHSS